MEDLNKYENRDKIIKVVDNMEKLYIELHLEEIIESQIYNNNNKELIKKILDKKINLTINNVIRSIEKGYYYTATLLLNYVKINSEIYNYIIKKNYIDNNNYEYVFLKKSLEQVTPTKNDIIGLINVNNKFINYCITESFNVDQELFDIFTKNNLPKIILNCVENINQNNITIGLNNDHIKNIINNPIDVYYLNKILPIFIKHNVVITNKDIVKLCQNKQYFYSLNKMKLINRLDINDKLIVACKTGPNLSYVRKIIKKGGKPNLKCLLISSKIPRNSPTIKFLIKQEVKPTLECLMEASKIPNNTSSIKIFLDNGIKPNTQCLINQIKCSNCESSIKILANKIY